MKNLLYIIASLFLTLQLGNISYALEFIDDDRDGVQDNAIEDELKDRDPNTLGANVNFVCTRRDIEAHEWAPEGFINYGCDTKSDSTGPRFARLGKFSPSKKDFNTDSDDDGINDLEDTDPDSTDNPNTIFDETRFLCSRSDVKNDRFDCQGILWAFSTLKRKQFFDFDRDWVNDFEDREENTAEANRNFICTKRDIQDDRIGGRYGCTNINQLWVFSGTKKAFLLDNGSVWGWVVPGLGGTVGWIVVDGGQIQNGNLNLDAGNIKEGTERNDPLKKLQDGWDGFIVSDQIGERWIFELLVTAAKDLKNIFFLLATIFFLYLVVRLLFSENTEDDTSKFKSGILWTTVGIVIMQLAYSFVFTIYDGGLGSQLGTSLVEIVIEPLIQLLETLASFFFIIMWIIAFYRLVTSNGEEQAATDAKTTIINAVLWFLLVQLAAFLVSAVYNASWNSSVNPWEFSRIIVTIINWMNSFVWVVVIVMIIYTGAQVLLSAWEEEKITNAKKSMVYIVIGIVLLLINFLILTFFFTPSTPII